LNRNGFMKFDRKNRNICAAVVLTAVMGILSGCGSPVNSTPQLQDSALKYEAGTLTMGTGEENSLVHLAGAAVSAVISNTVPGIYVALEPSKGSMINAANVSEGKLELALISGDVAYDAVSGEYGFGGEELENLCVLGACYQEVSGWAALKDSGLTMVNELRGKIISTGSKASATELAAEDVFEVLGIDDANTELYSDSISASVAHVKRQTADASHAFTTIPNGNHESIAAEMGVSILAYTEEELEAIVDAEPRYFKTVIPAGTYTGQEEDVPTFGIKVLLCASKEMDEDLAYEIARALDLNGPTYAGGHKFMEAMLDETFLCNELPIPLHEGAKRYYEEAGFLKSTN